MNLKDIKKFFNNRDRFAAYNDIRLLSVQEGKAVAEMTVNENHMNGADVVHGGALFTLADFAFAAAANSHGTFSLAIDVSIQFVKAASGGVLTAEAEEMTRNSKLSSCRVTVFDESGDIVAVFLGLAYRKSIPLPLKPDV